MKRIYLYGLIMFIVCFVATLVSAQDYDVTFKTLLEEMTDVTAHSKWAYPSYTCRQSSSYSRLSVSPFTAAEDGKFRPKEGRDWGQGWFENHDFDNYLREEEVDSTTEYIMLDTQGAGVIVRFWAAYGDFIINGGGIYRIYIDGNEEPVIEADAASLVGGNALVSYPFSYCAPMKSDNNVWQGHNLILPIPYATRCKISFRPNKPTPASSHFHYYQINYRSYEVGTKIESFNKQTLKKYAKELYAYSTELTGERNVRKDDMVKAEVGKLTTGESHTVSLKGERCITSISVQIAADDIASALHKTFIKIRFDGEQTVCCPIGQFFGIGYRQLANNTFYVKTHPDGMMTAYWVMPFAKTAEVTLENSGYQNVNIEHLQLTSKSSAWDNNRSMYFHAAWTESPVLDASVKFDYNYISIEGKGKFVADNLTIYNYFPDTTGINWWGEGDEKIFVDNEEFPSHFGTGTEDYYSYAYCRPQPFSFPAISQPIGDGNKTPGLSVNNRYRLLDDIPFKTNFEFYMEIWHPYYDKMDYSPATFWYAFKGCKWRHKK